VDTLGCLLEMEDSLTNFCGGNGCFSVGGVQRGEEKVYVKNVLI
jgi:hypothetical protein